ncbi:MAG TPA: hypothetical protein VMB21_06475 [Candidatus Limnocylindria bacterium]|jgi:hypothetical protein|nr:hypothetical protein [Candidatus Limnocylindria bacterium]
MSNREIVVDLVNRLPPDTSLTDIARRLEHIATSRSDFDRPEAVEEKPAGDAFLKWRGRGRSLVDKNTDEYLRLIRDGDSD